MPDTAAAGTAYPRITDEDLAAFERDGYVMKRR